jgi:hypothetical protein
MTHLLNKLLSISGSLEEELDDGGQQLKLDLSVLVLEGVQEALQQFVRVIDALGVLANDPDHGSSEKVRYVG